MKDLCHGNQYEAGSTGNVIPYNISFSPFYETMMTLLSKVR
jgi:hypothetical protein